MAKNFFVRKDLKKSLCHCCILQRETTEHYAVAENNIKKEYQWKSGKLFAHRN